MPPEKLLRGLGSSRGRASLRSTREHLLQVPDSLAEALPSANALGGLFFDSAYLMDLRGETVLRMQKERSVFESKFRIDKAGASFEEEEGLLVASLMVPLLLDCDHG